jgi:predicted ATP-dependent protease
MASRGYHIFIAGPPGTGKMTTVNAFLAEAARKRPPSDDTCYVYNFADPEQPRVLRLPPGKGRELARDLDELLTIVRRQLPLAFESDEYTNQRDALFKGLEADRDARLGTLGDLARDQGFNLEVSSAGLALVPLANGRPMQAEEFNALGPADRASWQLKQAQLEGEIGRQMKEMRKREAAARDDLARLNRDVALHTVGGRIADVAERYAAFPAVAAYLAAVRDDLVAQADLFRTTDDAAGSAEPAEAMRRERTWRRYRVNVLVDGSASAGAPVVVEANPTYANLLGRIEHEAQLGVLVTDFTLTPAIAAPHPLPPHPSTTPRTGLEG